MYLLDIFFHLIYDHHEGFTFYFVFFVRFCFQVKNKLNFTIFFPSNFSLNLPKNQIEYGYSIKKTEYNYFRYRKQSISHVYTLRRLLIILNYLVKLY